VSNELRKAATRCKALAARSMPVELTHLQCAEATERHGSFRKVRERTGRRFLPGAEDDHVVRPHCARPAGVAPEASMLFS
jgi:hypothetical protein